MKKLHLILTIAWTVAILPTLLWWRESLFWIVFMSLYAIISTHWSAWQAADAAEKAKQSKGE